MPFGKHRIIIQSQKKLGISQRWVFTVLSQAKKTLRRIPRIPDEEAKLGECINKIVNSVWQVWIPEDHSGVKVGKLASKS